MSGENFRVAPADERTSVDGKPVRNKVLLAMADNEYELMRADLTYIDLPSHLFFAEALTRASISEFVYFPNRGMVSQVVVTKDGRTVEVKARSGTWAAAMQSGIGGRLERSSVRERIEIGRLATAHGVGECVATHCWSAPQLQTPC